ncbi:unnamed protein product [Prorocentrum cordatum]|uniref:C3H1-type domain-containing protein n=1 Tax=Prorocentrum cordatum TaxID=2364126 RepID=A0ABN9WYD9_9DINO|nr:unnamed protein product [Polarella glacialis]
MQRARQVPTRNGVCEPDRYTDTAEDVLMDVESRGSRNHHRGQCNPCRYIGSGGPCPRGQNCDSCHYHHGLEKFLAMTAYVSAAQQRRRWGAPRRGGKAGAVEQPRAAASAAPSPPLLGAVEPISLASALPPQGAREAPPRDAAGGARPTDRGRPPGWEAPAAALEAIAVGPQAGGAALLAAVLDARAPPAASDAAAGASDAVRGAARRALEPGPPGPDLQAAGRHLPDEVMAGSWWALSGAAPRRAPVESLSPRYVTGTRVEQELGDARSRFAAQLAWPAVPPPCFLPRTQ